MGKTWRESICVCLCLIKSVVGYLNDWTVNTFLHLYHHHHHLTSTFLCSHRSHFLQLDILPVTNPPLFPSQVIYPLDLDMLFMEDWKWTIFHCISCVSMEYLPTPLTYIKQGYFPKGVSILFVFLLTKTSIVTKLTWRHFDSSFCSHT